MSDEVTISMARDVAASLKALSILLRKEDPHGDIAGVGRLLVLVVEQRDRLRARVADMEAAAKGALRAQRIADDLCVICGGPHHHAAILSSDTSEVKK